jgi:hypothetical protein
MNVAQQTRAADWTFYLGMLFVGILCGAYEVTVGELIEYSIVFAVAYTLIRIVFLGR